MEDLTPEKARAMQDAERAKATLQGMDAEATAACAGAMLEARRAAPRRARRLGRSVCVPRPRGRRSPRAHAVGDITTRGR